MEYTVNKLAALAGVSSRTLRYYDQIALLRPARVNTSGYRIYGQAQVNRLQQFLFYRELGLELAEIGKLLDEPGFSPEAALQSHLADLKSRRERLGALIFNAESTLATIKGEKTMSDKEKFEGFKQKRIEENETKYGKELREKYGDAAMDAAGAKAMKMTEEQYKAFQEVERQLNQTLAQACREGSAGGASAQKAAALHREWLGFTWPQYSAEAHKGLAQMYVEDERFTAHYDKIAPGCAALLRDAIHIFCGSKG